MLLITVKCIYYPFFLSYSWSSKRKGHRKTWLWRQREEVEVWLLPIHNPTIEAEGWSAPCSSCSSPDQYPLNIRLGGPQGWLHSMENLASTGIWSLDHPAHSKSLCQLCHPDYLIITCLFENWFTICSTYLHDSVCCDLMMLTSLIPIYLQQDNEFSIPKLYMFTFGWTMPLCETPVCK